LDNQEAHKARDRAIDREQWRRSWIMRFVERQRVARRWTAFVDLADWCAQSATRASVAEEDEARKLAYRRLADSVLTGEFEWKGVSQILYLVPDVFDDGGTPRFRLTGETFGSAAASGTTVDLLRFCWLRREMARQWLVAHGYPLPSEFETRSPTASPARRKDARPRPLRETKILAVQRYIADTYPGEIPAGVTDKEIARAMKTKTSDRTVRRARRSAPEPQKRQPR